MDFDPLPPDPYVALGVSKDADSAAIKTAYRKLALKYHPDKCTNDAQKEQNTEIFHKIQKAYDIIGQDDERQRYDAMLRLHELRAEKIKLTSRTPGRPPMRSYTYYQPETTSKSYTFEERRPRHADDDDLPRSSTKVRTDSYTKRRAQPVKVEIDDDRRRRETRTRTYEYSDERSSRRREYDDTYEKPYPRDPHLPSTERKYADFEEEYVRYTSRNTDSDRPSMYARRSSTRDVPLYETRRSRAAPRDRERDYAGYREDDILGEDEKELGRRVLEALRRRKEAREHVRARDRSRERANERKERERDRARERERDEKRSRNRENIEPYSKRPATLQQSYSSPPILPGEIPEHPMRSTTYAGSTNTEPAPRFERSSTMPPEVQTAANTSAKRDRAYVESKLKNSTALGDSGYSSSSQPEDKYASKKSKSKDKKIYTYPVTPEPYGYRTEIRAPGGVSSPQERPSATSRTTLPARTPTYTTEPQIRPPMPHSSSSSRALPDRSRRARDHVPDAGYYNPGHPPMSPDDYVIRGKRYDNISYSSVPRMVRTNTMPSVGAS